MTRTTEEILVARQHDRDALRRALREGDLERVRRGAYRPVPPPADVGEHTRARSCALARTHAVHRQLRADLWFSHETAALLWGCPLWSLPAQVHVVQGYRPSSRSARDIARHQQDLPVSHRTTRGSLPVTTLVRTVVDCALTMHPLEALVIADGALQRGLDVSEAGALLAERRVRKGRRRAAWVLGHADAGAQSPWETWLRYVALRAGLPRPQTQAPIVTTRGTLHCDLGWEEWGVYAEFDGRYKYRDDGVRAGHDAEAELLAEKSRFDAIRATGVNPVRVTATRDSEAVSRALAQRFPEGVRQDFRTKALLPAPPHTAR